MSTVTVPLIEKKIYKRNGIVSELVLFMGIPFSETAY